MKLISIRGILFVVAISWVTQIWSMQQHVAALEKYAFVLEQIKNDYGRPVDLIILCDVLEDDGPFTKRIELRDSFCLSSDTCETNFKIK